MRWLLAALVVWACAPAYGDHAPLPGSEIAAVLERSQQTRLQALTDADPASVRAHLVRESFEFLRQNLPGLPPVELRVIRGDTIAETLHGHIVIANESLADLPEGERLFVLGHELGHAMLGHWAQMQRLYERWVPGPVVQEQTDPIAGPLGLEAAALAHKQEYEADAFGARTLRRLGHPDEDAVAAFVSLGVRRDTPTHPGTARRIAALREYARQTMPLAANLRPAD